MAAGFELFVDEDKNFRFRLVAPDGTVLGLSRPFTDKAAAVAGIGAVRGYAGTGLITDLCPKRQGGAPESGDREPGPVRARQSPGR